MTLKIAGQEVKTGTRQLLKLRVTRRLIGSDIHIAAHVLAGARPGPTVGMLMAVHGDEVLPIPAVRTVLNSIDLAELAGNVVVVPVANPVAFAAGTRASPDHWGKTDLWHCFPGAAAGTVTQQMAHIIATQILPAVDVGIEFHSGGVGRIQNRVEYEARTKEPLKKKIFDLAASFGTGLIHESPVPDDGPTGYLVSQGKPCFQVEVGGPFLSGPEEDRLSDVVARGVRNVLKHLKMIPGTPEMPERQFWFARAGVRFEANPMEGGYLLSRKRLASDIGTIVEKDEVLGEMLDPYGYEILETIKAPVKGILFFIRLSGPIEAGNKGFAIAKLDAGRWVRGFEFE